MQLARPSAPTPPPELATGLALRAAELGQRPAVSQLTRAGRAEQGFVTLAQWAAKGAHLLEVDHQLGPGDEVCVDVPASWPLAAVCAAVWWTGATVVTPDADGAADAVLAVVHEDRAGGNDEVLVVGDAVDGGPTGDAAAPAWAVEVQAFPDQPPAARATPAGVALRTRDGAWTHAELVASFAGDTGVLGVEAATVDEHVRLVAARPLVTGRATVVLDGVDRAAADGDRVARWA